MFLFLFYYYDPNTADYDIDTKIRGKLNARADRSEYPPAPYRPEEAAVMCARTSARSSTHGNGVDSAFRPLLYLTMILMRMRIVSCAGSSAAQQEAALCFGKRFSSDITGDGHGPNAVDTAPAHNTRAQAAAQELGDSTTA